MFQFIPHLFILPYPSISFSLTLLLSLSLSLEEEEIMIQTPELQYIFLGVNVWFLPLQSLIHRFYIYVLYFPLFSLSPWKFYPPLSLSKNRFHTVGEIGQKHLCDRQSEPSFPRRKFGFLSSPFLPSSLLNSPKVFVTNSWSKNKRSNGWLHFLSLSLPSYWFAIDVSY